MASSDGNGGQHRPQTARTGPRTVAQIELELESVRGRLSVSIEELVSRVHPAVVQRRVRQDIRERVQQVKDRTRAEVQQVKERARVEAQQVKERARVEAQQIKERVRAQVFDEYGDVRTGRLAVAGGALVGVVALVVVTGLVRRRHHHRHPA